MIYSVYLRNYFSGTTFNDLKQDLARIAQLGSTHLWLMPFYPVGAVSRKGSLGSPYAITDYKAIDPSYGSHADFRQFVQAANKHNLKVLIDIVFHHTAPDHPWARSHPEYYWRDANQKFGPQIADWSDVIDLDFSNQDLRKELIDCLDFWARSGVSGFRCDVAPLVPLDFWAEAKEALRSKGHQLTWISESLMADFINDCRARGLVAHSDDEIRTVFDLGYDYFLYNDWERALQSRPSLEKYIQSLNAELAKPELAATKLRFVENHDTERIRSRVKNIGGENCARAWEMFFALLPGEYLVYAGAEFGSQHKPSHFDRDICQIGQSQDWIHQLVKRRNEQRSRCGSAVIIQLQPDGLEMNFSGEERIRFPLRNGYQLDLP